MNPLSSSSVPLVPTVSIAIPLPATGAKVKALLGRDGFSNLRIGVINFQTPLADHTIVYPNDNITASRERLGSCSSSSSSSTPYCIVLLTQGNEEKEERLCPINPTPNLRLGNPTSGPPPVDNKISHDLFIRRLKEEIDALSRSIDGSPLQDEKTKLLQSRWLPVLKKLFERFRHPQSKLSISEMSGELLPLINQAQNIASDVLGTSLDETALLGNDGYTYDSCYIARLAWQLPQERRGRSPMKPDDPRPFTTEPHLPIRALVKWLGARGALLPVPERFVNNLNLLDQKQQDPPPSIIAQNTEKKKKELRPQEQRLSSMIDEVLEESSEEDSDEDEDHQKEGAIQELFNNGMLQLNNLAQQANDRIKAEAARLRQIQESENILLQKSQAEIDELVAAIGHRIVALNHDIAVLDEEAQQLHKNAQQEFEDLNQIERDQRKLGQDIKQVEIEIKKQQRNQWKEVVIAIAVVGACIIASQVALPLLAKYGVSLSVVPVSGGTGAMVCVGK